MSAYALLGHTAANATAAGTLAAASDNSFAKATVNTKFTDSTTFLTLSATNTWTHAATGNYQIKAQIAYGLSSANSGVNFRAGLYNETGGSFAVNAGGAVEIIGQSGAGYGVQSGTGTWFVNVMGRYTVGSTSDHYSIRCAGDATAGTWFTSSYAQGAPAALITNGTKPETYKLINIIQE